MSCRFLSTASHDSRVSSPWSLAPLGTQIGFLSPTSAAFAFASNSWAMTWALSLLWVYRTEGRRPDGRS